MAFYLKFLALIVAYAVAAKLGLSFATTSVGVTTIWPAGGIAVAALVLGGLRYLPAVLIGAVIAALMINTPWLFGIGSALANTLETYVAFVLLTHFGISKRLRLDNVTDLALIVGVGAVIPAMISALIGTLSLMASGVINAEQLPLVMFRWWRGDVLGIAFVTPLILVFARPRPFFRDAARLWEVALLWAFSTLIGQMVFLGWQPFVVMDRPPQVLWLLPLLFWAGYRTGRRNTGLLQLLFLIQALASAYLKIGLFADEFESYGLMNFWVMAMTLSTVGMAFAIVSTAQRHAAKTIAQNAWVFQVSHDGVLITDAENNIVSVNNAFTEITGYSAEEVEGRNPRILASGRHERAFHEEMWRAINATGYWTGEVWNRRKDGSVYLEQLAIHTITDARNKVTSHLGIFSDITQKKAAETAVTHQAQHDFLTKLPNRLLFCDRFTQQLATAKRYGHKFALFYMDLDKFKPVNDQLGHAIGDELLIAVASRLVGTVREIDTVSRFGGDEFAILMSEVESNEDVVMLANKVLAALSKPFNINHHQIEISASIGISVYPDNGLEMTTLINHADACMYQAKREGHNRFVLKGTI